MYGFINYNIAFNINYRLIYGNAYRNIKLVIRKMTYLYWPINSRGSPFTCYESGVQYTQQILKILI